MQNLQKNENKYGKNAGLTKKHQGININAEIVKRLRKRLKPRFMEVNPFTETKDRGSYMEGAKPQRIFRGGRNFF